MKEKLTQIPRKYEAVKSTGHLKFDAPFYAAKAILGVAALTSFIQGSGQEGSVNGSQDHYYSIFVYSLIALGITQVVQDVLKANADGRQEVHDREDFWDDEKYQQLILDDEDAEADREFEEKYVVEDLFNRNKIQLMEYEDVEVFPN